MNRRNLTLPALISVGLFVTAMLAACDPAPPTDPPPEPPPEPPNEPAANAVAEAGMTEPAPVAAAPANASKQLTTILDAQPEAIQARYTHRRPQATLEFFEIQPGMTVVETLPGHGWYSQILMPYLGPDGHLIAASYAFEMWPMFGFFDADTIESMRTWTTDWPAQMQDQAQASHGGGVAPVEAFEFGALPTDMEGTADAVLFIRSMHNLARFEDEGGYLSTALDETYRVLKPGGIVGVVQHEARPDTPDDWAAGAHGYIKKQLVIDRLTEAGFELVDASSIHENPNDQPGVDDHVWRLPPTLATSGEDPELRAEMEAIGESHRMMLKFRKPE